MIIIGYWNSCPRKRGKIVSETLLSPLVFQAGKAAAEISFPAYDGPWGTCDFMTDQCRKHCILKTNSLEKHAAEFFEDNSPIKISRTLCEQLDEMKATTLCWFIGSGDCPKRLTEKVTEIIALITKTKIKQNGFTRNKKLWENCYPMRKRVRLALTVEAEVVKDFLMDQAHSGRIGYKPGIYEGALIAIPNYKTQIVRIKEISKEFKEMRSWGCGAGWVEFFQAKHGKVTVEDCSLCALTKKGCYRPDV